MRSFLLLLIIVMSPSLAHALTADELLLVVNKSEPRGMELAQFYAKQRNVPENRIVEIDVPPWNDVDFYLYENRIARPIRNFLRKNELHKTVKCIVTFYGVPLRVQSHGAANAMEQNELKQIAERLAIVEKTLTDSMTSADALAKRLAADDVPKELPPDPALRAATLLTIAARAAERIPTLPEKEAALGEVMDLAETLLADVGTLQRLRIPAAPASTRPAAKAGSLVLEHDLLTSKEQFELAVEDRMEQQSRVTARQLAARFGLATEINVLRWQQQNLTPGDTLAAVDNELTLLMMPGYPRASWAANLLQHARPRLLNGPPIFMVSRIDGPSIEQCKAMIDTSIAIEAKGLVGPVIVDSGLSKSAPNPGYIQFDANLDAYAAFVKDKTKLQLVYDALPALMPKDTTKDAALYVGWYSLRNYAPPSTFTPGAVGYHVASLELITLHDEKETGWVHGMLKDGVTGTLGAVAEPYLHSFPPPTEFFPLLMTGRLTLAEVYWKTCPLASWMQALVGDPLYTPYKSNPALTVGDLPVDLQKALAP